MYTDQPGQCCGTCVQTSCVFNVPGISTPVVLQVNTTQNSAHQKVSVTGTEL